MKRKLKFSPKDTGFHVIQRTHGNTWQVIATMEPELFSPLIGLFLIQVQGTYYRAETKMRKDAIGRQFPKTTAEPIEVFGEEEITESKIIGINTKS